MLFKYVVALTHQQLQRFEKFRMVFIELYYIICVLLGDLTTVGCQVVFSFPQLSRIVLLTIVGDLLIWCVVGSCFLVCRARMCGRGGPLYWEYSECIYLILWDPLCVSCVVWYVFLWIALYWISLVLGSMDVMKIFLHICVKKSLMVPKIFSPLLEKVWLSQLKIKILYNFDRRLLCSLSYW